MIYPNETRYHFIFIGTILLFFLIDLCQFFIMGILIVPCMPCICSVFLMHNTRSIAVGMTAFLLFLESFCFYNFFSLAGLYLLPTICLAVFFKKYLYPSKIHVIFLALITALIQIYAIEGTLLHSWQTNYYTIMRISAMILLTICFSLTINIWGMQDNRA